MDLVLCHTTADFDTLGAAVGVTRLKPGSRIVLTGGCHAAVQNFLALHRDEYALIERRAVSPNRIRSLTVVDTQQRDRLGPAAAWIDHAHTHQLPVTVYDHHLTAETDISAFERYLEPVGATTTLVVEQLQEKQVSLTPAEATAMALGIHVDTGSLTFERSTSRDAAALAWLMEQGASLRAIADAIEPGLSPMLQELLSHTLETLETDNIRGHRLSWVILSLAGYVPGLSSLAAQLMSLTDSDTLILAAHYPLKGEGEKLILIGRSRDRSFRSADSNGVNLSALFKPLGGGGHPTAASAMLRDVDPSAIMADLLQQLRGQIPKPPTAREVMSSPVRTIRPRTTIAEAQRILLRYGHSGLSVVNDHGALVGVISRRDIDLALHHGFSHAPVKGYMTTNLKTITPDTFLPEIETLMVTYDIGRLPVLDQAQLVGIVTRTDVLRQLHQDRVTYREVEDSEGAVLLPPPSAQFLRTRLQTCLNPRLWKILQGMATAAEQRGWHLYLVGGAVRDLLMTAPNQPVMLQDVDLVVDGFYRSAQVGAGGELARRIKQQNPEVELQVYGRFQTAALVWHKDSELDSMMIDIATARTEFYPYPAANPEVEASSIRQDLYRRDFTINAMAIQLTEPEPGKLLDFFGGLLDLQDRQVRVLHPNSFIEDPTRIYRAVRFAVRLGFQIDGQTEAFIRHAIESGVYPELQKQAAKAPGLQTRLKRELKYVLEAPYWQLALGLLDKLGALKCLHGSLEMSDRLWHQLRRVDRWMERFNLHTQMIPWQIRLEVLITQLAPDFRRQAAENLQLPIDSINRLTDLAQVESHLLDTLPACEHPSEICQILSQRDLSMLLLVSVRNPRPLGQIIWQYLTTWSKVKPPLNGNDFKKLGYKPGPQYRTLLDRLMAATLDGKIRTRSDAEAFLAAHYPVSET
ncbi:MAG: CBS domain-containing protein [Leptolyngbyaceae cyanobacterium MO_188.B28]|nr:CBS domain-containing protein [Leptolyngbyaceae cyanobacterium MO_188.B28]